MHIVNCLNCVGIYRTEWSTPADSPKIFYISIMSNSVISRQVSDRDRRFEVSQNLPIISVSLHLTLHVLLQDRLGKRKFIHKIRGLRGRKGRRGNLYGTLFSLLSQVRQGLQSHRESEEVNPFTSSQSNSSFLLPHLYWFSLMCLPGCAPSFDTTRTHRTTPGMSTLSQNRTGRT